MSYKAPYIISSRHAERRTVEDFVKARYETCYGAKISHFPERLLVLKNETNEIVACCGLRDGQEGFISERYIDEGSIAERVPGIDKNQLWEFTTLAASDRHSLFAVIQAACDFGRDSGKTAAIFTTTDFICRLLKKRGVELIHITAADERHAPAPGPWGTYYADGAGVYLVPDTLRSTGSFAHRGAGLGGAHAA